MRVSLAVMGAIAAASVAGCAEKSSKIAATPVPVSSYSTKSCPQLMAESHKVQLQLADYSGKQDAERAKDTAWMWGGGLIFIPAMAMAATGEDYEAEIGRLKGESEALNTTPAARRCL